MARLPELEMAERKVDLKGTTEEKYNSMVQGFYSSLKGIIAKVELKKRKDETKND